MKKMIVVFAFGSPVVSANQILAKIAKTEAKKEGVIKIITQKDIPLIGTVVERVEAEKNPPSTFLIAEKTIQWAHQNKIDEIIVIAAPMHLKRCIRDLKHNAKKLQFPVKITVPPEIFQVHHKLWYSKESLQKHTHSSSRWWVREIIIRLMPMWAYKWIIKKL